MTRPADRPKPERESLVGVLGKSPAPISPEILARAAEETGFPTPPVAAPSVPASPAAPAAELARPLADTSAREKRTLRRTRVGRDNVFNVRINDEAFNAIYDAAESRNVPLAQIVEEAMALYVAKNGGGGR